MSTIISYLTQHIYELTSYKEAYKYPFIATEILSSRNRIIEQTLLTNNTEENNNILNLLKVLDNKEVLNTTLPGYINKIITSHLENELLYDSILKNSDTIFDILFKYIYNDSYRDIFYLVINEAIKKEKKEFYDFIPKIFEYLMNYMNKYITDENINNKENEDEAMEIKSGIKNLIIILIKLAENNDKLFDMIVKKLSEEDILKNLLRNMKEIDDESSEEIINLKNRCNINAFYCVNKISLLFSNLFNIILTKNENDKYAYYKYYLLTIIEPSYSLSIQNQNVVNNDDTKEGGESNENKDKSNENEEKYKILIDSSISYLNHLYSNFENKIEVIDDINKHIIYSTYNSITDILILIILIEKKDNEKLCIFLNNILIDLIQLIIEYPNCSILHNKTLEIVKLILEYNLSIKKDKIIRYLKNYLNEKKINELITDDGVINNNKKESSNNIYLVNILNLLEKQDNKKIVEYLEKNSQGLYENEKLSPEQYVPTPDEEEMILKKKEDIHDSEAFIFTPKKIIEDSKKIMKNLKELDV